MPDAIEASKQWAEERFDGVEGKLQESLGGPARRKVIFLLACVLALEGADLSTVGASAVQLESAFHINYFEIGLLVSVTLFMGAFATLPFGVLVDRIDRTKLLAASIVLWCLAEVAAGSSNSYLMLVLCRLGLGAVTAVGVPALASLTGDFFPANERARIYGYILAGDFIGAGIGFLVSGNLAGLIDWRWAFWWLVIPGAVMVWAMWKLLPEPARGGQSHIQQGDEEVKSVEDVERSKPGQRPGQQGVGEEQAVARKAVEEKGVRPNPDLVLHDDPTDMHIWDAVKHILSIHTNVILIVASALGYFFFAGVQTLGVVFVRGHYGLGQSGGTSILVIVGIGALFGVLVTGHISDWLIRKGVVTGRILVGAVLFVIAPFAFAPGLASTSLWVAIPLFTVGAICLAGPNPPLDAARLDIMHSRLWGRAESVRAVLRRLGEGISPLLFGWVADFLGGHNVLSSAGNQLSQQNVQGLEYAFLIFLVPLLIAGSLMFVALKPYPTDVASAAESEKETRQPRPDKRAKKAA